MDSEATAGIKAALESNDQALAVAKIKDYLKTVTNIPLHIGITGETGSGKSSFINAFRGVGNKHEAAAKTGCKETTLDVRPYPHPKYPNVTLWDLPGIGTTKFPADKYLRHVGFEKFDFFIVISDTRFKENDVKLVREIQRMGKNFYFIRSKIDNDLRAEQFDQGEDFDEGKTLDVIRKDCTEGLRKEGISSPQVFLLSNFVLQRYDFRRLHETLERDLPKHKRDALLFAMPNISLEIIKKKKESFQEQITHYAYLSALGAVAPIPGVSLALDLGMLVIAVMQYLAGFGLDKPSLQRLSETTGVPLNELNAIIMSPLALQKVTPDLIMKLLLQCSTTAALIAAEEGLSFIPILGAIIAAPLSYKVTKNALENFLNMLAEDAQRVFERALNLSTSV